MENSTLPTILLIEDDLKLAELVQSYLIQHGFLVSHARDGKQGLLLAQELSPQLIILDLMLPELDGLSVCRELKKWYENALLILSASEDNMDHVAGLEMGADDFVCKPIHPRVLLARIRALLRRFGNNTVGKPKEIVTKNELIFDSLTINIGRRQVILNQVDIVLTEAEFELLWLLASNAEQPLSRDTISQKLRGIAYDGLDRAIDNKIVSLRKKLGDNAGLAQKIITVRGKGYLFVTDKWSA